MMSRSLKNFAVSLASPFTFISALWLKAVQKFGNSELNDRIFMKVGVLPVLDHYYQPLINPKKHLTKSLREDRSLVGVDLNISEQLDLLSNFNYQDELLRFPLNERAEREYYYNNGSFSTGDSEYLYSIIRYFKPKKICEVGSGFSTLMVRNAIKENKIEDANYSCEHICIEPYEQTWLERLGIQVLRTKVEDLDLSLFQTLNKNDVLFIDSSHVIRPQGDVLFEYLNILPSLNPGVLIHIHDVFTPRDYPNEWIFKLHRLWNEQYLLEAFLSFNSEFRILGALNYLSHNHWNALASKCPLLAKNKSREPGSFWIVRN